MSISHDRDPHMQEGDPETPDKYASPFYNKLHTYGLSTAPEISRQQHRPANAGLAYERQFQPKLQTHHVRFTTLDQSPNPQLQDRRQASETVPPVKDPVRRRLEFGVAKNQQDFLNTNTYERIQSTLQINKRTEPQLQNNPNLQNMLAMRAGVLTKRRVLEEYLDSVRKPPDLNFQIRKKNFIDIFQKKESQHRSHSYMRLKLANMKE